MQTVWMKKLYLLAILVLAFSMFSGQAIVKATEQAPAHKEDLGAMSRKLNDPTSDIWALQGEFDYIINKGKLSDHSTKNQYQFLFQPVLPTPLTENWKILTRPVVPIVSTAIPKLEAGSFHFGPSTGLGTHGSGSSALDWYRRQDSVTS